MLKISKNHLTLKSKAPSNRNKIKLGVVDDHTLFRKGLISLLEEYEELKVIMEASNGKELLETLKTKQPDILLMDVEMPVMNGIEATEAVRKKFPDVKILTLTMHSEEEFVAHLMEKGANGFLLKDYGIENIVDAIYSVYETGYYFNDKVSKVMLEKLVHGQLIKPQFKGGPLTEREIEIIRLICREASTREISEKLCISIRTVEGHRENILKKTGARNTAGIVLFAVKNNFFR